MVWFKKKKKSYEGKSSDWQQRWIVCNQTGSHHWHNSCEDPVQTGKERKHIICKDYVRSVLLSHVLLGHVILHRSRVLIFQITAVRKPSQTNSSLTNVLFLIHVDQPQVSSEEETERRQWSRCSPQCSAHH